MSDHPPSRVGTWPVVRGWPRSTGHALLELETPEGPRGAQWWADAATTHSAAEHVPGAEVVGTVLVHPGDRDPALPRFAERLAAGERVVVHRPGRRAVLRADRPGAPFTKVTRRRRALNAVVRHRSVHTVLGRAAAVAPVLDHGPDWISLGALPGRTLLDLGQDTSVTDSQVAGAWHMLGRSLRHLHAAVPERAPELTARHDAAAEVATTRTWLEAVLAWGLLPETPASHIEVLLRPLLDTGATLRTGLLHRDLHDKQVLIADGAHRPGLLDLDTAAWGEPALDVANLLAHLDLRVRQDLLTPWRAGAAREAFVGALAPDRQTRDRVEAYLVAARLRLSAVYALRPRWQAMARGLFDDVLAAGSGARTRAQIATALRSHAG